MGMRILGWGTSLPDKVVTNADLERMLDTSDQWIVERTGIRERHIGDSTAESAIGAGRAALAHAGVPPESIDLLVLATTTPDQQVPATSAHVHAALGLGGGAFDLNAACSGAAPGASSSSAPNGSRASRTGATATRRCSSATGAAHS